MNIDVHWYVGNLTPVKLNPCFWKEHPSTKGTTCASFQTQRGDVWPHTGSLGWGGGLASQKLAQGFTWGNYRVLITDTQAQKFLLKREQTAMWKRVTHSKGEKSGPKLGCCCQPSCAIYRFKGRRRKITGTPWSWQERFVPCSIYQWGSAGTLETEGSLLHRAEPAKLRFMLGTRLLRAGASTSGQTSTAARCSGDHQAGHKSCQTANAGRKVHLQKIQSCLPKNFKEI